MPSAPSAQSIALLGLLLLLVVFVLIAQYHRQHTQLQMSTPSAIFPVINWFHAVNSAAELQEALNTLWDEQQRVPEGEVKYYGFEFDVRWNDALNYATIHGSKKSIGETNPPVAVVTNHDVCNGATDGYPMISWIEQFTHSAWFLDKERKKEEMQQLRMKKELKQDGTIANTDLKSDKVVYDNPYFPMKSTTDSSSGRSSCVARGISTVWQYSMGAALNSVTSTGKWLLSSSPSSTGASAHGETVVAIFKFDIKEPKAAQELPKILHSKSFEHLRSVLSDASLWWNADVIKSEGAAQEEGDKKVKKPSMVAGKYVPQRFVDISQEQLVSMMRGAITDEKMTLSLGYVLPSSSTQAQHDYAYTNGDYDNMDALVDKVRCNSSKDGGEEEVIAVNPLTFAVRLAAVFMNDDATQGLHRLIDTQKEKGRTTSKLTHSTADDNDDDDYVFPTFWKLRDEEMTQEEIHHARSEFPDCSVDSS